MFFKNKTMIEIYNMIKDDPGALRDAKRRVSRAPDKDTKVMVLVRQALQHYEKMTCDVKKERAPQLKLYNLSVDELTQLISTNDTALQSVRQRLAPSRKDTIAPEQAALYTAALKQRESNIKQNRTRNKIERMITKLNQDLKDLEND